MLSKAQLLNELAAFNQHLLEGASTLPLLPQAAGVTPYEVVYAEDKLHLLHYQPEYSNGATPLLIVYALVNRAYMTDLQQGRSLIQGLLAQGQEVYLIDWGYPDKLDGLLSLADYINGYLDQCVQVLLHRHSLQQISLLGVCQGGVLSLCYSALNPNKVKNLITMVTPVNFHTRHNILSHWVQSMDMGTLCCSSLPVAGQALNKVFSNLKPYQLNVSKYLAVVSNLPQPSALESFILMEQWITDSPDLASVALREFVIEFFQGNKLIIGEAKIGERKVDLSQLNMPILNIYATEDHIVPPESSKALGALIGGDYEEFSFKGGHIGIYVSSKAQSQVPVKISNWLVEHSH